MFNNKMVEEEVNMSNLNNLKYYEEEIGKQIKRYIVILENLLINKIFYLKFKG